MMNPGGDVTAILKDLASGDSAAADRLLPLVYQELRALAGAMFKEERVNHTLQPTALVHEVFLKLAGPGAAETTSKAHFMALTAKVMRQLLIDHARGKNRLKRSGGVDRTLIALEQTPAPDRLVEADVLDIDAALVELAKQYPRAAQVVELKFFGGLTAEEIAALLGVGDATVERDWVLARGWLKRFMTSSGRGGSGA